MCVYAVEQKVKVSSNVNYRLIYSKYTLKTPEGSRAELVFWRQDWTALL